MELEADVVVQHEVFTANTLYKMHCEVMSCKNKNDSTQIIYSQRPSSSSSSRSTPSGHSSSLPEQGVSAAHSVARHPLEEEVH